MEVKWGEIIIVSVPSIAIILTIPSRLLYGFSFVLCENEVIADSGLDGYEDENEIEEIKKIQRKNKEELMKNVDFQNLSLAQKELIHARRKLLTYFDHLSTYEVCVYMDTSSYRDIRK